MPSSTAWELLHELWTRDVGTTGYDKKKWLRLEAAFLSLERGRQVEPATANCIRCGQPQPLHGDVRDKCPAAGDTDFFNFCIYQEQKPRTDHVVSPPWESLDDE